MGFVWVEPECALLRAQEPLEHLHAVAALGVLDLCGGCVVAAVGRQVRVAFADVVVGPAAVSAGLVAVAAEVLVAAGAFECHAPIKFRVCRQTSRGKDLSGKRRQTCRSAGLSTGLSLLDGLTDDFAVRAGQVEGLISGLGRAVLGLHLDQPVCIAAICFDQIIH